jgi:subtilase family serine protease
MLLSRSNIVVLFIRGIGWIGDFTFPRIAMILIWSLILSGALAYSQQASPRIAGEIDNSIRTTVVGSHPRMVHSMRDVGRVSSVTLLPGMSLVFSRSAAQEEDLQFLIAAQQDPSSILYHQWLNPSEFAERFGVSDSDINRVKAWLLKQGFSVEGVSKSKNRIIFSGNVGQVEAAFATEIHNFQSTSESDIHFAPLTDISIPSALVPLVTTVSNISSFRPRPHFRVGSVQSKTDAFFTSADTGEVDMTPADVATIYDIDAAYNSGYTGQGQSIVVVGQSAIEQSDVTNFQNAAGLPPKNVNMILVSNSGAATTFPHDESESDLDVEYSGAIAKGATIDFVYVGNAQNFSVWDSIQYAVDANIAPIIATSYGTCETALASTDYSTLNGILAQATAQGQSVIAAAGDSGSTDCYGEPGLSPQQWESLSVDFPASSQYVTAMGGTEFPELDVAFGNTNYWQQANGSDLISSALKYIPEQVWNEDSSQNGLASSGGGVSTLTSRPSWQVNVNGIPQGEFRLVPDISLDASNTNAPYLYCSSDFQATEINGSCSHGFWDSNNQYLTRAGGTSFAVPIFAAMVAIINQKLQSSGQGVVNAILYKLASNPTTYASVFHDITSGSNDCTAGPSYCNSNGESQYSATGGYDEATGLGSIDFNNLLNAWPSNTSSPPPTNNGSFTLSASNLSVASGHSGSATITITPQNGYSGTITWSVSTNNPLLANACYDIADKVVSGTSFSTIPLTISTNASDCSSASSENQPGVRRRFMSANNSHVSYIDPASSPIVVAFAGLIFGGFVSRRKNKIGILSISMLSAGLFVSAMGCGGSKSSPTSSNSDVPKGTYSLVITGTDSKVTSITASTSMTLTVD